MEANQSLQATPVSAWVDVLRRRPGVPELYVRRRSHTTTGTNMKTDRKCLKCDSASLVPGALNSGYFQPDNTKFLTLNPNVRIRATICTDCGYIELNGDLKKARALTSRGR